MKNLLGILLLCHASFSLWAAEDIDIKLNGIVVWGKQTRALLQITETSPVRIRRPILQAGEMDAPCEVRNIDAARGRVRVRNHATSQQQTLLLSPEPGEAGVLPTFHFQSADSGQVLEVYQMISGRTILAPALPSFEIDLKTGPSLTAQEAMQSLDRALRAKGLVTRIFGDKFVVIIPEKQLAVLSQLTGPPVVNPAPVPEQKGDASAFPPGLIKFTQVPPFQILEIYQDLAGKTVLRPDAFPGSSIISVRSQTPLTRGEAIWMLDTVLLLNGIKTVPEGHKFVFAVPVSETNALPVFAPQAIQAKAGKDFKHQNLQPGNFKLTSAEPAQILNLYAELLGRQPVIDEVPGRGRFSVRSQTALSSVEAIFALEAVAALNHARFELVGQDKVKLIQFAPPPGGFRPVRAPGNQRFVPVRIRTNPPPR